jgi:CcmD family protein
MGDMIFLAAGYAVIWIVAFVFIYSMVQRQQHLQKELTILEQLVQREAESD